nr:hypothetical protein [Tanacetum cinerariifolium]
MSTSNTHQQSLADIGFDTRPPMLEGGSYIPWASRFRRYLNRKRENRKWLNKAIDEGPYEFRIFTPSETEAPKLQKEDDLRGDDLKHYKAKIEAMNLILISIPNDIYNSVDACKTTKAMWQRVERLMRETVQNKVNRETRFNNKFDQFVAEPGEALVSVYNCFAQLMNNLERNDIIFPNVTVNIKFLNCLQPEWLKAKKLEKSHDHLALVAHTGSSFRTTTPYYVTHPPSVVDYDDDYQGDIVQNNYEDPLTSGMILLARNIRRSYVQEEIIEGNNVQNDAGNIQRTLQTTSSGTAANVQCYNYIEKGTKCKYMLDGRIQPETLILTKGQAMIMHFLVSQPNSPQLAHEDLEQIHPHDMKEMEFKMANGHVDYEGQKSDQAEEGPKYALVAYTSSTSDSKVSNDSTCSKTCLEIVKLLKTQNKQLLKDLKKSELMVLAYKTGLKSGEERLEFFKKNKFIYLEDIKVLKVEIQMKEIAITELRRKLEVAQKEKGGIQLTIKKLENASKSLNKLIDCQIIDNYKKGLGYESYNAIPPSYIGNFMPPKPDLSYTGLDEFVVNHVVENKSSE